jgi:hypothetical protein
MVGTGNKKVPFIYHCGGQKEIKELLEMSSPAIATTGCRKPNN